MHALTAFYEHQFATSLRLQNRTRFATYDKFYQNVFPGAVNATATKVALSAYNNANQRQNVFNQSDLIWDVATGNIQHKLVFGLEVARQENDNLRNTGYFVDTKGVNVANPQVAVSNPRWDGTVIFKPAASDANNHGITTSTAVYAQDQLRLNESWEVVAGLRQDYFKVHFVNNRNGDVIETKDTPVSPRLGVLYHPSADMSIYSSYSLAYVHVLAINCRL